jgi:RNA polymerase sigma-70 factor (ECF subfamily)
MSLNYNQNIANSNQDIRKSRMSTDESLQLKQWIALIACQRDKNAFREIFSWFAPKIIRFGIKQLNNESSANELLQETMTNVWKKAHLYHSEKGAVTTWVYTIMRNVSFDMLRKIKANKEDMLSDDIWPLVEAENIQPEAFQDHLMTQNIQRYLELLPDGQRQIVKGVYFQELSQEQLAQQLNIPLGTVKSRLRTALNRLKKHIGEDS